MSPAAKPARKRARRPVRKAKRAAKPAPRADFGQPVDGFFAKQSPALSPITDALRALVAEAAPTAVASLKWGMPFYELGGEMLCAIGAHKRHVNLILPGPAGTYADPGGLLVGAGKTGRHLKLTPGDTLPRTAIRGWLRTAVARVKRT